MSTPREYLKIKYSAPHDACKCGNCQLVPPEMLQAWAHQIDGPRGTTMARFSVEDLVKLRKAAKAAFPTDVRLLEKIKTELEIQKINRAGRAKRGRASTLTSHNTQKAQP